MLKLNKDFQPQDETQLLTEVVIVEGIVFSLATPLEAYRDLTSLAVKKILFGGTPEYFFTLYSSFCLFLISSVFWKETFWSRGSRSRVEVEFEDREKEEKKAITRRIS